MADADAHADVVVAEMRCDRSQAVMAGAAAAGLHPHLAGHQIQLVMEDDDVGRVELVEARAPRRRRGRTRSYRSAA